MRQLSSLDTRADLSPGARLAERPRFGDFPERSNFPSSVLLSSGVTNPFVVGDRLEEAFLGPFDV